MTKAKTHSSFGDKVKSALGIQGDTKTVVLPMFSYTAANIATSGASYFFTLYYLAFLSYVEGLSGGQIGTILLLKSIWDAITDPLMGIITDRTRSRFGRHRVYIIFGAVPFIFTFFMTWYSFGISGAYSSNTVMLYYIAAYFLYSTATTVLQVPHTAMLPELAPDYFLRTQYNSVSYLMNSAGMVPSFLIASAFLGLVKTKDFNPSLRPSFMLLGVILSLFYIVPVLITGFTCKERSSLNENFDAFSGAYAFREYKEVFRNKAFRQYFLISILYMFANGFYNNTKVYFLKELAHVWSWYNLTNIIAGVFEAAGFPLNFALTKNHGKQRSSWVTTPFMLISFLIMLLISGKGHESATLSLTAVVVLIHCAFYNFGLSGMGFTINNTYPDITDVDEMITGRRREGVIATFNTFVKKIASGFMGLIVLTTLEWFGVTTTSKTGQTGTIPAGRHAYELFSDKFNSIFGIKLMGAALPMIFIIIALICLKNYKMNKSSHTLIRAAIATRHMLGRVELSEQEKKTVEQIAGQKWENMWISTVQGDYSGDCTLKKDADGRYIVPEKDDDGNYFFPQEAPSDFGEDQPLERED